MSLSIYPGQLKGTMTVPPSKSVAHRAIICASLARGVSHLTNIQYSDDIIATIEAMKILGATIDMTDDDLIIDGSRTLTKTDLLIDAHESGSTLRFLIPVSLVPEQNVRFIGQGRLGQRPLDVYYQIFDNQDIDYQASSEVMDLSIKGQLKPGTFNLPGNISSQYISGLLFALPLLDGDSIIDLTSPLESSGYVDLTLDMLEHFGIQVIHTNHQHYVIPGHQQYRPHDEHIEADYSQAAFFLVADALGSQVTLKDLNIASQQGDRAIIDFLVSMGAECSYNDEGLLLKAGELKAIDIDASQQPDLMPIMAVACANATGISHIYNAGRLRIKECDRLEAIASMLMKAGIKVIENEDSLTITGGRIKGCCVETMHDHRMAMSAAILALNADDLIVIDDETCVKKSYPDFFKDYKKLGGNTHGC